MFKKVLNLHEEATFLRLSEACDHWDARIFSKVRLADILPIENSGISDELYRFALQGHFDFLVADGQNQPLFAIEFDGPSHETDEQNRRDLIKNALCEHFELPILRINSRYLLRRYRDMDLLSWFVDYWFLSTSFYEAQEHGLVPAEEGFDALSIHTISTREQKWPLWLSVDIVSLVRTLANEGKCCDPGLSHIIGMDSYGNYFAIGFVRITRESGAYVRSAMRVQQFPVDLAEALEFIVAQELFLKLKTVLAGEEPMLPITDIYAEIQEFRRRYKFMSAASCTRGRVGHAAI